MAKRFDEREMHRARVGLLLIAIAVGVSLAVFFLDTVVRATTEGPRLTVTTESAPGVGPGTAVWVAGRNVGRVLSVEFREPGDGRDRVVIRAVVDRGIDGFIRADAVATIQPGALLAPVVIFIDPGSPDQPLLDLSEPIRSQSRTLDPARLLELGVTLRARGDTLRLQAANLRRAIAEGSGTLASLSNDPDVLKEAAARMTEVSEMLGEHYSTGTVGLLASDTMIDVRLARIRERLGTLDTLRARERAISSIAETTDAIEAFQNRLMAISDRLDDGEGTAGRALRDGELARQVALLRARLDSTAVEFMKYPDRWLRVKIF